MVSFALMKSNPRERWPDATACVRYSPIPSVNLLDLIVRLSMTHRASLLARCA